MGAGQSTCDDPNGVLHLAAKSFASEATGGGDSMTYFGGAGDDDYFGGAKDADPAAGLRDYESSMAAKTKEEIIRRIARALKMAGISVDPESSPDEIVRALQAQLPDPRKGAGLGKDANHQAEVCKMIANVLNEQLSPGHPFIDVKLSPENLCHQVGEWVHTLALGVNSEFLAVHASVQAALKNITVLDEIMASLYEQISGKVSADGDDKLRRETAPLSEVYKRAQGERRRQEELLKNILHVKLMPAMKELESAMKEESAAHSLIKRIGLKPGSSDFAESLAWAVNGLGTAASIAARVNKALKDVGLSVRQYLDSKEYAEFQRALDARIESGSVKPDDLAKFLKAVEVLRSTFSNKKDIASQLESATGGRVRGGDDDAPRSAIDKRVEASRTEKKVIVRDFVGRMSRHYDEILAAINALAPQLGKSIPITDKTDLLRDAIVRLTDMRSERIELSLVGLYSDASSRERKERFISGLRMISEACGTLMELEMFRGASALFSRLKAAIDGLEKTVNYFSDVIVKKFGGDAGVDEDSDAVMGGDDSELLPEIARSSLSLAEAVSQFQYYYYLARVRTNLAKSEKELTSFGEKYVETLGDAVAARLFNLRSEKAAIDAALNVTGARKAGGALAAIFPEDDTGNKNYAAAKKFVDQEYEAKQQLYRALQAVDLYMKEFTAGIARDPDAVHDMKKMLDGTEVIARWFDESTGENLWKAFEAMGSVSAAGAKIASPAAAEALRANNVAEHYYQKVAAANSGDLGVPEIGVDATRGLEARKSIDKCLEFFQALKNLVNGFARIGSRFGGVDIRTKVFMSPPQIYKALMDYLRLSALSLNSSSAPLTFSFAGNNIADAVAPYQVFFSSVNGGTVGRFEKEDRYFTIIIKSMAAKILTTLGVFDMFERSNPLQDLTPTRIIIGGGFGDDEPEIVEAATELYFRLPRLVEFYRRLLRWDPSGNTASMKVAMLPEVEGVFSGLIRLVFQKMTNPESGDYSESELCSLIREINSVHSHFREKDGERATHSAIDALVCEINRRYGIIKSEDMVKYWELMKRANRSANQFDYNNTDYAILPGEDEYDVDIDRRAPSDRYAVPGSSAAAATGALPGDLARATQLDDNLNDTASRRMLLRGFRRELEKMFEGHSAELNTASFSLLIKQAEGEIRRSSTRSAKVAVVSKLIQGTNVVDLDANKAFMFNETVVVGLNALGAINTMIERFEGNIRLLNAKDMEDVIVSSLTRLASAGAGAPTDSGTLRAAMNDFAPGAGDSLFKNIVADGSLLHRRGLAPATTTGNAYAALAASWGAIQGAPDTDASKRGLRLFARLITDYNHMMRMYIENVFDISSGSNGLVEVRFQQNSVQPVQISFSKLRATAENILTDVKAYIDSFRPYISKSSLDKFESIRNKGSVFWLERELVDKRFRGVSDDENSRREMLEGISRSAGTAFQSLVRDTEVGYASGTTLAAGIVVVAQKPDDAPNTGNKGMRFETFGRTLSALVFYDASVDNSGLTGLTAGSLGGSYDLKSLLLPRRPTGAVAPVFQAGTGTYSLYGSDGLTRYRSLMFAFNQILSQYLASCSDPAGARRIYISLVGGYANGAAARSVASPDGNSHPDMASTAGAGAFGKRGDPKAGAILLQSLAYIIQRLVKDVNPTTSVSDHLVTTLTDVPLYVKESLRANLPGFVHLFDLIVSKGEFIKMLVQKTTIDCWRPALSTSATDAVEGATGFLPGSVGGLHPLGNAPMGSDEMKARLVEIIDGIDSGAYSLASSAAEVLKELGDAPVFAQTQEGSIETYKLRYGKLPLMPLSSALYFLGNLDQVGAGGYADRKLYPRVSLGEPAFKLQYAVRGLLASNSAVELATMPSVRASLDAYNGVSAKREQIDSSRYLGFVRNVVSVLRFVTDARNYKSALSTSKFVFSFAPLVDDNNAIQTTGAEKNAVYAINNSDQAIVTLYESSNQEEEMSKIVALVGNATAGATGSGNREKECILNIIDINIIPINVHAFMRDVPLANVYNYEYTFEQFAAAYYGATSSKYTEGKFTDGDTLRTHQMFLRMLVDPYLEISAGMGGFVKRIFRGDNDLGLGRPKFLSDQVFGKALLGNIYANQDWSEAGPGHSSSGAQPDILQYLTTADQGATNMNDASGLKNVAVPGPLRTRLKALSDSRFDTRFVRNLFFIVNVLRLVRGKLSRELSASRSVLVTSHAAVAPGVTEYGADPFIPNEVFGSKLPNGQPRYSN